MKFIKIKITRHQYDALNQAIQQFTRAFIDSNRLEIEDMPTDSRESLSRRVMLSLLEELLVKLQRIAFREASTKVSFSLSETEAIAMFYLLQNLPLHPADVFTFQIVTTILTDLHKCIIKPAPMSSVLKNISLQKTY